MEVLAPAATWIEPDLADVSGPTCKNKPFLSLRDKHQACLDAKWQVLWEMSCRRLKYLSRLVLQHIRNNWKWTRYIQANSTTAGA